MTEATDVIKVLKGQMSQNMVLDRQCDWGDWCDISLDRSKVLKDDSR